MSDQENEINPTPGQLGNDPNRIKISIREEHVHEIDFSKINTVEDVVEIFKAMDIRICWRGNECPERFKAINDLGFLQRIK